MDCRVVNSEASHRSSQVELTTARAVLKAPKHVPPEINREYLALRKRCSMNRAWPAQLVADLACRDLVRQFQDLSHSDFRFQISAYES